jgi:ankyrin repeat protein
MKNLLIISALLTYANLAFAASNSEVIAEGWPDISSSSSGFDTIDEAAIASHPLNQAFPPPDQTLVYSKPKDQSKEPIKPVTLIDKTIATKQPEDATLSAILGDDINLKNKTNDIKNFKNRKVYDYRDKIPAPFFQKEHYAKPNNHLPGITYQGDFTRLLFTAVDKDNLGAISSLLERGADINGKLKEFGITPLMVAVKNGSGDIVQYLILKGANINITDNRGSTALHIAAKRQDYQTIMFLLDNGASMDISDNSGRKALDYIPENQRVTIIINRLTTQAEFDQALLDFTASGSYIGASLAIRKGANVNTYNKEGETPLLIAIRSNNKDISTLLLSHGANPLMANKCGMVAMDYAEATRNPMLAQLIDTYTIRYELEHGLSRPKRETSRHIYKPSAHHGHIKAHQKHGAKDTKEEHFYEASSPNKPQICEKALPNATFIERVKASISKTFSSSSTDSKVISSYSESPQATICEQPLPRLESDNASNVQTVKPLAPKSILPKEISD